MSVKKKITISDRNERFITATARTEKTDYPDPTNLTPYDIQWSFAINSGLEQFQYLLFSDFPELSNSEWQAILNCYSGCYFPAHRAPARVASDLMDDVGASNIDELEPWYADLVKKVGSMSQVQQMAIVYFAQTFWMHDYSNYADFDQIKAEIISKLK